MKKGLNILYWAVLIGVVLLAISFVSQDKVNTTNYKIYSVNSGSMEPEISVGSLIFVNETNDYVEGDIVTYRDTSNPKQTTTHRIVSVETDEDIGKVTYVTKGDANEDEDMTPVEPNRVLGEVIFNVPLLGYPVGFAKTQTGFILLIIIPATLIIYSEINSIKNEAKRKLAKRSEKKSKSKEAEKEEIKNLKKSEKNKEDD
ncbi:signal peptidase I [Patescibacteria group bacterium]